MMYLLRRHILGQNFFLRPDCVHHVPEAVRRYHSKRFREAYEAVSHAVNARETKVRLRAVEAQLDKLVAMGVEVEMGEAKASPLFDDSDVQDLAESLAEDRSWLPHGSHVETTCIDTSTPLQKPYGPVYTNTATTVSIQIIGAFTPRELLEQGLVTKGGRWNHVAYEAALKATPGVVSGRLMGPREAMLDRQEAGRAKYPRLWTNG
jgi:hypothetical protein